MSPTVWEGISNKKTDGLSYKREMDDPSRLNKFKSDIFSFGLVLLEACLIDEIVIFFWMGVIE
jgi:hypothetical protein